MNKNILIIAPVSTTSKTSRCKGGVDAVSQVLINGIIESQDKNNYLILAFNPFNDCEKDGETRQLKQNIKIIYYNSNRNKYRLIKIIPNFIWHNLIIRKEVLNFCPDVIHAHINSWLLFRYKFSKTILTLHSYRKIARTSCGPLNDFL